MQSWIRPRGVDLYVGGVEHAVLHLLYARFWHQVLYNIGVGSTAEPFGRLFLQRLWRLIIDETTGETLLPPPLPVPADAGPPLDPATTRLLHQTIIAVRDDYAALRFNTAIARIIELTAHASRLDRVPRALAEPLVLMVAPLAPHVAEELWQRLGHPESLAYEPFPPGDPALAAEDTVTLPVQVNGRRRFAIEVPATAGEAEIADLLARHPGLPRDDAVRLVIIPGKIVNIVLRSTVPGRLAFCHGRR